jgi:hypothetical protein
VEAVSILSLIIGGQIKSEVLEKKPSIGRYDMHVSDFDKDLLFVRGKYVNVYWAQAIVDFMAKNELEKSKSLGEPALADNFDHLCERIGDQHRWLEEGTHPNQEELEDYAGNLQRTRPLAEAFTELGIAIPQDAYSPNDDPFSIPIGSLRDVFPQLPEQSDVLFSIIVNIASSIKIESDARQIKAVAPNFDELCERILSEYKMYKDFSHPNWTEITRATHYLEGSPSIEQVFSKIGILPPPPKSTPLEEKILSILAANPELANQAYQTLTTSTLYLKEQPIYQRAQELFSQNPIGRKEEAKAISGDGVMKRPNSLNGPKESANTTKFATQTI